MTKATKLIDFPDMGLEAWCVYDSGSESYEIFASEDADDYIGSADTKKDALIVAKEWAEGFMA